MCVEINGKMLGQCISSTRTNCLKFHQGPKHSDRRKVECSIAIYTSHSTLFWAQHNYTWLRHYTVSYVLDLYVICIKHKQSWDTTRILMFNVATISLASIQRPGIEATIS